MKSGKIITLIVILFFILTGKYSFCQIEEKYRELGGKKGYLGKPRSEVLWTPDRSGKFQLFKGGNIYWKEGIGAFAVHGKILGKYGEHHYEQGVLGYPVSDVLWTPDRSGKFQKFEGGNIYWKKRTGAHEIHGEFLKKYGDLHYEQGILGYPKSDVMPMGDGRGKCVEFQKGAIYWTKETGAHEVHGILYGCLTRNKGVKHPANELFVDLGYPVQDVRQFLENFLKLRLEKGQIEWWSEEPGRYRVWRNSNPGWLELWINW
jgi:uncharacterized protein with LGFP repeats